MIRYLPVGYQEALKLTLDHLAPLAPEAVPLEESVGRVVACDLQARVDSPSVDASLRDGYAVRSKDLIGVSADNPVHLEITGSLSAGSCSAMTVQPGTTIRVLTGAKVPSNADAILAEEYVKIQGDHILALKTAEPGRNILPKGSDVRLGQSIIQPGDLITPGLAGLLAAAGHSQISVIKNPSVSIIATGDEVVAPGKPLGEGKLYASNIITLHAWCRRYGLQSRLAVLKDDSRLLEQALEQAAGESDAIVTSGGAWTGDRDMMVKVLNPTALPGPIRIL